jgi:hypothetical protein
MPLNLKILGAVLLMVSLAFPPKYWVDDRRGLDAQSWRTPVGEAHDEPEDSGGYAHGLALVVRYALGLGQHGPDGASLDDFSREQSPWVNRLMLLAFSWPVIAVAFALWRKQKAEIGPRVLVLVLLAGTFVLVCSLSTFAIFKETRVGPGGYLAFLALALYATGAIWADTIAFCAWKRERGAPGQRGDQEGTKETAGPV